MAHNVKSMFFVGKEPWHGLGKRLASEVTASEAIVAAGLDWSVAKYPCRAGVPGSERWIDVPWRRVVVREDTQVPLGIVGQDYEPIQNREAFSFFDSVVGSGQAIYHTAGALGQGEKIWMLAKLPGDLVIGGKDRVEKFMLLSTGHDGGTALRMMMTPVRVVCQNTLNAALSGSGGISIHHTGDIGSKINAAKKALGIAHGFYLKFGKFAEALAGTKLDINQRGEFIRTLIPDRKGELEPTTQLLNQRREVSHWINNGAGHREIGIDTAWAAVNGAAQWADHHRPVRGEDEAERASNRLSSIWFGTSARIKERAFEAIQAVTGIDVETFGKN